MPYMTYKGLFLYQLSFNCTCDTSYSVSNISVSISSTVRMYVAFSIMN